MAKESTIYSMLVEDLSEAKASRLLKGYIDRSNVIYNEAYRAAREDSVYEEFAPYYEGHVLFFLHQTMFINLARDCDLKWQIKRCEANGFPIAVVYVGRFHFTSHHASSPYEVACLNPSLMRAQNSNVNMSLLQRQLFDAPFDEAKLTKADDIYGNFIHGCRGTGQTFVTDGFTQIAFPIATSVQTTEEAKRRLRYVERYSLYNVIDSVVDRENQIRRVAKPTVLAVAPKIKKQQ